MPSTKHDIAIAHVREQIRPVTALYPTYSAVKGGQLLAAGKHPVSYWGAGAHPPPLHPWVSLPPAIFTDVTRQSDFLHAGTKVCIVRPEVRHKSRAFTHQSALVCRLSLYWPAVLQVQLFHRGFRPVCPSCGSSELKSNGWGDLRVIAGLCDSHWVYPFRYKCGSCNAGMLAHAHFPLVAVAFTARPWNVAAVIWPCQANHIVSKHGARYCVIFVAFFTGSDMRCAHNMHDPISACHQHVFCLYALAAMADLLVCQ